ncbi:MAG TPA: septum formation initiator family protein [Thermoleophilaceae bacterium]|nr:septum formation initiator family protein [Thermoleophilaceae bacterium]
MDAAAIARTRRSAQRRATRAGAGGGIRWDRLSRLALLVMLGVILLLYISPIKHWFEQSGTRAAQRQELSRLNAENALLKGKVRRLSNPGSLEQEARRLGMVRQGERSYVIENPPRR